MPAGAADRSRNEKERPKKEHGLDCTDNSCGTGFAGSRGSMACVPGGTGDYRKYPEGIRGTSGLLHGSKRRLSFSGIPGSGRSFFRR